MATPRKKRTDTPPPPDCPPKVIPLSTMTMLIGMISDLQEIVSLVAGAESHPAPGERCQPRDRAHHLPRRTALD